MNYKLLRYIAHLESNIKGIETYLDDTDNPNSMELIEEYLYDITSNTLALITTLLDEEENK